MKQYKNIMAQLPGNAEDMGTCGGIQSTGFLFPTMKPLEQKRDESKAEKAAVNASAETANVSAPSVQIDLTKLII